MNLIANILWLICGGLVSSVGYFASGILFCLSIIGIPLGLQLFKIGLFVLWPFGSRAEDSNNFPAISCIANVFWFVLFSWWIWLLHILIGLLLCITIIGIPFGMKQFQLARLTAAPFGKTIYMDI